MKKLHKRFVSFLTATVMMSNLMPLDEMMNLPIHFPKLPSIFTASTIKANAVAADSFNIGEVSFSTPYDFIDYCSYYADDTCMITVEEMIQDPEGEEGTLISQQVTKQFADAHQNDNLTLTFGSDTGSRGEIPEGFVGLGNDDYPFNGTITLPDNGSGAFPLSTYGIPLFSHVNNSVKILSNSRVHDVDTDTYYYPEIKIQFARLSNVGADTSAPLFAQHVYNNSSSTPAHWNVETVSTNALTYSGVIGDITADTEVNLTYTNSSAAGVVSNASTSDTYYVADVGAICGELQTGSILNLSFSDNSSSYSITSAYGNAGGLVGSMNGNARVNLLAMSSASASKSVVSTSAYSGGLVGNITSEAIINMDSGFTVGGSSATSIPVGGSVTGAAGAGGLFGYYENVTASNTFDIKDYSNEASVYGRYCGGLFGVLDNKMVSSAPNTLTITDTTSSGHATLAATSGSGITYDETGYFGGLVGRYTTDSLTNSLELSGLEYSVASDDSFNAFGGAIGYIDVAAYVKADNVAITASGTGSRDSIGTSCNNYAYFGGLVGATSASYGDFIDLGDFTLTVTDTSGFNGGGVVGQFYNGVLRFSGITDMTNAKPNGAYATTDADGLRYASYGQLVGYNDNVLVYALGNGSDGNSYGSGWSFKRSSGAISDDLGTWGEVVRSIDDSTSTNAIYFDSTSTNHTATIAAAKPSMGNADDFVRTALNIQLNQGSGYNCLLFTSGNNTRSYLLGTTLTISSGFSLSGTGINGFMRDGTGITVSEGVAASSATSSDIGGVGTFIGTLSGGNNTITLATGEKYGFGISSSSTDEGIGQIYRHQYNGLFSVIGNDTTGTGTVNSLNIAGTINIRNAGADGMSFGAVAARSHGNTALNAITVSASGTNALTVNYHEGAISPGTEDLGKNIGGFIGYVDENTDNGIITITGTSTASPKFVFTGSHKTWLVYGGVIGKIASESIIVNIEQSGSNILTVGMNTDVDNVTVIGDNSDCGGLIGYIISNGSYDDRKINVRNVEFNGCVINNCAEKTAGGFLGYAWMNTTTTIDGVTVKGTSSINNTVLSKTAANVGVICYVATGKWTVNSLSIKKMSMTNGGGTSLGIIVNKAYNSTDGLYLDVLNSGYKLTNADITLPNSIGDFDELAAYSASDVIAGGGGVVSVNTNSSRSGTEAKITVKGTYQNQISRAAGTNITAINAAKYANGKSRYYYNLDVMSNADYGQNLVLWSVSKYAASNIADEFIQGEGESFGTTIAADFKTGILTFSGTANLTGLSFYPLKNADTYTIGDLSLTFDYSGIYSTAENVINDDSYIRDPGAVNQHFLMHSGLFMNLETGKAITVTGDLSLAGTFLGLDGTVDETTNSANGYSGVIISKVMNGNFICETGSIALAGITPKTTDNGAYTGGYLLINNIVRESDTVAAPQLIINNLYSGSGYTGTLPVASSLIGSATGNDLTIKFSHVKLDARTTALSGNSGLDTAYNTSRSIFNDAVFLHSIKTNQTATLEYYYTYAEDWEDGDDADSVADRYVTYGKEVKDSLEYRENDVSLENCYSGSNRAYTNPISGTGGVYNFSSGWLPYVAVAFTATNANEMYNRELKVNVEKTGPETGCGTYNHPYVVSGDNLVVIAKFISSGEPSDMQSIRLPKTQLNGITNNAKGDRWCASKTECAVFELATSGDNNGKYVYTDSSTSPATVYTWTSDNVRLYLASAYYKISSNITLGANYVGLGCTTVANGNYAFRGVIVGEQTSASSNVPKWTITNNSPYPLINVSNGSVIKDVNINVDAEAISRTQSTTAYNNAYFGYNSQCQYYGGIIGEIMGGDNIIDNSYVVYSYIDTDGDETDDSFSTTIQLTDDGTNTYGTIIPVGGYVGVVVYGGLIFKNMTAAKTTVANTGLNVVYKENSKNLATDSAEEAIYVNPIVGRVINGYAVNESNQLSVTENGTYHDDANSDAGAARTGTQHTLKNGKKHYSIADIQKYTTVTTANSLSVTPPTSATADGTITVPNAQALFILSLITQSGAGTATTANSNAYVNSFSYGINTNVYGMSHIANYSDVGTAVTDKYTVTDYDNLASKDTAANTALPYIIKWYTYGTSTNTHHASGSKPFTDDDIAGKELYIVNGSKYLNPKTTKDVGLEATTVGSASPLTFTKLSGSTYTISYSDNGTNKYLGFHNSTRNLTTSTSSYTFTITKNGSGKWEIQGGDIYDKGKADTRNYIGLRNSTHFTGQNKGGSNGAELDFYEKTGEEYDEITYSYPARFVTTSTGYYDISLTGSSYVMPDSFRGLGCVGNYVAGSKMKVDSFTSTASNCTIDVDIYLNKFEYDNYFNNLHSTTTQILSADSGTNNVSKSDSNHGIGLFDSIVTKNASSSISNFTLSGSVNTEIFSNDYSASTHEMDIVASATARFLSVGGVCGASLTDVNITFDQISLNNLTVCGSSAVGGLLGYSGNVGKAVNGVETNIITATQCSATNLSMKMNSSSDQESSEKARNGLGGFVGVCFQGKVIVQGNSASYSTVGLKSIGFESANAEYRSSAGGLVGFAGDGCQAYNMKIQSSDSSSPVTIGGGGIRFTGGICGAMQSRTSGAYEKTENGHTAGDPIPDYVPTCYAVFENCTIENINFKGQFVGGIYGGKWGTTGYTPYSIAINNCKVTGNSASPNTIEAVTVYTTDANYAGGFIGRALVLDNGDPNILIQDSTVSNYSIKGTYCGGFIGYSGSFANNSSVTCYIHDSSVIDCTMGASGNYAGGAIGRIDRKSASSTNKILGYNIKLDDVEAVTGTNMGAWVGYVDGSDDTTSIQFSGMAVYENGFTKNVGNRENFDNANFVFADYDGRSKTSANNTVSNFNDTNNVEMPKAPYVNINPHSAVGTNEIISGDGAVLFGSSITGYSGKTADQTMAAKIYSELSDTTNTRRYTSFVDDPIPTRDDNTGVSIDNYMKHIAGEDGDRISTYQTEAGSLPTGVNNFAVVVISNTDNTETTNLINRYIQLVTNTSNDYTTSSNYYNIAINTCKYSGGKFSVITDTDDPDYAPGLTFNNGVFALSGANADSGARKENTFTLIDVQFTDPFDSDHTDVAYHLYVPVYTVKQMTFSFSAAALTDTNSVTYQTPSVVSAYETAMASNNRLHVDSLNTWVTQYIRFSYTAEDLNILLSAGNLKWNHNKYVTFNTQIASYKLPDDTYMVLVDPNGDSDKVYYASADDFEALPDSGETGYILGEAGWKIDLTNFTRDSGGTSFSVSSFNKMIAKEIEVETLESDTGGMYNELTFAEGHTVTDNEYSVYRIDNNGIKHYYEYVGGSGNINLSVSNSYVLNEDYYISMYVPKVDGYDSELYFYRIDSPSRLTGTKSAARTSNSPYNVLIADLYEQTTSYTLGNTQVQITDSNRHIEVNAETTIRLTNDTARSYLLDSGKPLYHAFDISLNCYGEDGSVVNEIAGYDATNSTATYKVGNSSATACVVDKQSNYILVNTTNVMSNLLNASNYTLTVSADIDMVFSDIQAEFPEKLTSNPRVGVNVSATSNLAYDSTQLTHTSMTKPFAPNNYYYYRESANASILTYKAKRELDIYDTIGEESKNYSRLGVNGRTSNGTNNKRTAMLIDSEAVLNATAIEDETHATTRKIRFTLTLNKKTDTPQTANAAITKVEYVKVNDISNYLSDIELKIGNTSLTRIGESTNDTYIYEMSIDPATDKIYSATIQYYVITGSGFTEYANYQVFLEAELIDGSGETIGNKPTDYLVYTNAKVYPTVIEQSKSNP